MVQDLVKNWFSDNKIKITSPVVGAFMGSWVLFNWKHFLLLFWGKGDLEVRLTAFEKVVTWSNLSIWLWPLVVALIYAFGLPYLNVLSHKLLKNAEEWRHDEVVDIDIIKAKKKASLNEELYKGDPANPYLGRKLEAELKQKEADAEKAHTEAEMAIAEQEGLKLENDKINAENKQEQLKLEDAQRRDEREKQVQERTKAYHHQEILNAAFPTVYLLLDKLSASLHELDVHTTIGLMSESIALSFGYSDIDEMLTDHTLLISNLSELSCVIYEDKKLLSGLRVVIDKHHGSLGEDDLFDSLSDVYQELGKFKFIPPSFMGDIAKEFIDDSDNLFGLLEDENVTGAMADTNAFFEYVENPEFISISKVKSGNYVARINADISGTNHEDKPFSGDTLDVSFNLVFKPVIGNNGFSKPNIEDVKARVKDNWRE